MKIFIASFLIFGLAGCDRGPQYTVNLQDNLGYLYRTNQSTGEVCAFRPYRTTEFNPKTLQQDLKQEGFVLIGCANK